MKDVPTIGAAKFKEQCLSLMDALEPEGLVITKHGHPVARLMPIEFEPGDLIGCLEGKVGIKGDVYSTGVSWEASEADHD